MKPTPARSYPGIQIGRRYFRSVASVPASLLSGKPGSKVGYAAYVLDVSTRGLRLRTSAQLTRGDVIEILRNQAPHYPVRSRVAWTGKLGTNEYGYVGVEFYAPFPTNFWTG